MVSTKTRQLSSKSTSDQQAPPWQRRRRRRRRFRLTTVFWLQRRPCSQKRHIKISAPAHLTCCSGYRPPACLTVFKHSDECGTVPHVGCYSACRLLSDRVSCALTLRDFGYFAVRCQTIQSRFTGSSSRSPRCSKDLMLYPSQLSLRVQILLSLI